MKPALVLGLALAANAMAADFTDNNELFVAPTGKFGDHIQRFPGKIIMYDEVADDELAVALAPRSVFKSDEEYQKYVHGMPRHWDDAADDELAIKLLSRDRFKTEEEYQKYYNRARFTLDDAADDELVFLKKDLLPKDGFHRFGGTRYFDKEAGQWKMAYDDDEFVAKKPRKDDSQRVKEHITSKGWTRPEAADDELVLLKKDTLPKNNFHRFETIYLDKETGQYKIAYDDDELFAKKPRKDDSQRIKEHITSKGWTRPEAADDELLVAPTRDFSRHPFDANGHVLRDNIGRPVKPVLARFDEAADDELAVSADQYQRLQNNKNLIYSKYDEVADDELGVKYVHLPFEHVAYDDDELAYVPPVLADDELAITPEQYHRVQNLGSIHARFDEAADDELAVSADQYQRLQNNKNPIYSKYDEVADDELAMWNPRPEQYQGLQNSKNLIYSKFDEVADDELAYLGHLLNERAQPKNSNEVKKAEKPSHGKTKEKTQMKRKFRPVVDEAPLAQN